MSTTITSISPTLRNFFDVEERNAEANSLCEQTLATAADSLSQAPFDVIEEWFGGDAGDTIEALAEFAWLLVAYPVRTPLADFDVAS